MADEKKYPQWDVIAIVSRDKQKDAFCKVGAAWTAKDDGIIIHLYAMPFGNEPRLLLKPYKPPENREP